MGNHLILIKESWYYEHHNFTDEETGKNKLNISKGTLIFTGKIGLETIRKIKNTIWKMKSICTYFKRITYKNLSTLSSQVWCETEASVVFLTRYEKIFLKEKICEIEKHEYLYYF